MLRAVKPSPWERGEVEEIIMVPRQEAKVEHSHLTVSSVAILHVGFHATAFAGVAPPVARDLMRDRADHR